MPAQIKIEDNALSYSKEEWRFLFFLAKELPDSCVLRACHERNPPSPLNLAIDLRLVQQVYIPALDEKTTEAKARGAARKLQDLAKKMLRALPELVEDRFTRYCPTCGRKMTGDRRNSKSRHPGTYSCDHCHDKTQAEREAEDIVTRSRLGSEGI